VTSILRHVAEAFPPATSKVEFGESVERRERKRVETSGAKETKNMYEGIEKKLIELIGQLKGLIKTEKAATQEERRSKHTDSKVIVRKETKK